MIVPRALQEGSLFFGYGFHAQTHDDSTYVNTSTTSKRLDNTPPRFVRGGGGGAYARRNIITAAHERTHSKAGGVAVAHCGTRSISSWRTARPQTAADVDAAAPAPAAAAAEQPTPRRRRPR